MSERSTCGIHVTYRHPCRHCARANAANEAALADVQPRPGSGRKTDTYLRDADVARIQQLREDGMSVSAIAEQEQRRTTTIKSALEGHYVTVEGRKRIAEFRAPIKGQHARSASTPLPRHGHAREAWRPAPCT